MGIIIIQALEYKIYDYKPEEVYPGYESRIYTKI